MAREFPIHNGRMTTDLDANGHKIKNLPPGSGFTQVQSDWNQTDATAPDFIKNKPTIPAPVTIDPALSQTSENPVQNKVVTNALYSGFTPWVFSGDTQSGVEYSVEIYVPEEGYYVYQLYDNDVLLDQKTYTTNDKLEVVFSIEDNITITATRHAFPPTKTSQLTNDGAPNGGGTPYATTAQIPDVTGKADKVSGATAGNLASLTATGNLADSGAKPSDFAAKAELPYALVTPGEWEFSGLPEWSTVISEPTFLEGSGDTYYWEMVISLGENPVSLISEIWSDSSHENDLSVTLSFDSYSVTATRPSLPGHLCDRAGNRVVVSGDTTLTLPALVNAGKLRDFLVRLEISGSTVPTITFSPDGNESVTYETDGDEFPVPDEAGTWSYSFTENCVSHKFAVALKKVNVVAQGGS